MNPHPIGKWLTIASGSIAGAWLRVPHTIQILLYMMALDFISGVLAAAATSTLSSKKMFRGVMKNLAILPTLAMLHLIERPLAEPPFNMHIELETLAAYAFLIYTALSIVENSARGGLPVPSFIVSTLAKAKIKSATAEEIHQAFANGDSTTLSAYEGSKIIKTPEGMPDLKLEKKVTVIEEQHLSPIPPNDETPKAS